MNKHIFSFVLFTLLVSRGGGLLRAEEELILDTFKEEESVTPIEPEKEPVGKSIAFLIQPILEKFKFEELLKEPELLAKAHEEIQAFWNKHGQVLKNIGDQVSPHAVALFMVLLNRQEDIKKAYTEEDLLLAKEIFQDISDHVQAIGKILTENHDTLKMITKELDNADYLKIVVKKMGRQLFDKIYQLDIVQEFLQKEREVIQEFLQQADAKIKPLLVITLTKIHTVLKELVPDLIQKISETGIVQKFLEKELPIVRDFLQKVGEKALYFLITLEPAKL